VSAFGEDAFGLFDQGSGRILYPLDVAHPDTPGSQRWWRIRGGG
jgi:hypothetical protein